MQGYAKNDEATTLDRSLRIAATEGWEIYPAYGVYDGTCRCRKGPACPYPGKHPATRHGIKDASSDPLKIVEMFARNPGCNPALATGVGSGVAVLDWDMVGCGGAHRRLQEEHGPLPATRTHRSGSGSLHGLFAVPAGLESLPSLDLIEGCELKADGTGVLLPPSRTNYGRYEVLSDAPLAELPDSIVETAMSLTLHEGGGERGAASRFVLPERIASHRNNELTAYGGHLRRRGWEHGAILEELRKANRERCAPPLSGQEVQKIARSVSRYEKGNAGPVVSPEVLGVVAFLEHRAGSRPKKTTGAYSRWAVYRALLDCLKSHGRMHGDRDVAVRIAVRRLALDSGLSKTATVDALAALQASRLVYRTSPGDGPVPGSLALRVPDTDKPGTFVPPPQAPPTVPSRSVSQALYRLRHGPGRIGKSAASVLEAVVDCPGGSRGDLAARLGKKPDSLSRPLKKLVDRGLVRRRTKGRYWPAENWRRVLERERVLGGEDKAERLDERRYEREMKEHRQHLAEKKRPEKARASSHEPREPAESEIPAPDATPEERIGRLVGQGMARPWAEAEVRGTGEEIV